MAIYCGTDIASVNRIKDSIAEFGDTFLKRIYTDEEIQYCESRRMSKYQSYAARFAAKEAIYKALSQKTDKENGSTQVSWHDAEIVKMPNGKPCVKLHGKLAEVVQQLKIKEENIDVSLSHDAEVAIAMIVINRIKRRE